MEKRVCSLPYVTICCLKNVRMCGSSSMKRKPMPECMACTSSHDCSPKALSTYVSHLCGEGCRGGSVIGTEGGSGAALIISSSSFSFNIFFFLHRVAVKRPLAARFTVTFTPPAVVAPATAVPVAADSRRSVPVEMRFRTGVSGSVFISSSR